MCESMESDVYTSVIEEKAKLSDRDRHRLLADERRRTTLDVLADRQLPVEVGDLAEEVAAMERTTDEIDVDTVETVAISLHHHHLPLMDDLGVVHYDPTSHRVE